MRARPANLHPGLKLWGHGPGWRLAAAGTSASDLPRRIGPLGDEVTGKRWAGGMGLDDGPLLMCLRLQA
jgi:hypothetical protein